VVLASLTIDFGNGIVITLDVNGRLTMVVNDRRYQAVAAQGPDLLAKYVTGG
jgi:hypothetical protein